LSLAEGPAGGGRGLRSRPLHQRHPPGGSSFRRRRRPRAAKPAVIAKAKAIRTPATSRIPKLLIIGVGEISRARKPPAVAKAAIAIVGPPELAAARAASTPERPDSSASSNLAWSWIA